MSANRVVFKMEMHIVGGIDYVNGYAKRCSEATGVPPDRFQIEQDEADRDVYEVLFRLDVADDCGKILDVIRFTEGWLAFQEYQREP